MRFFLALMACLLPLGAAVPAMAATYTYESGNYLFAGPLNHPSGGTPPPERLHTTAMQITGTFTLAEGLAPNQDEITVIPVSFTFFDGVSTLTESDTAFSRFIFWSDAAGDISHWSIRLRDWPTTSGAKERREMSMTLSPEDPNDPFASYTTSVRGNYTLCDPTSPAGQGCNVDVLPSYSSTAFGQGRSQTLIAAAPVAPVPLPASAVLLLAGLGGLTLLRRRSLA